MRIICLAAVGKDGLGPGIVLEKFPILGFYAVDNLGTQVRPFSHAGCRHSLNRFDYFTSRSDKFDKGTRLTLFYGPAKEELGGQLRRQSPPHSRRSR